MTTIYLNNTRISVAATDLYTEATSRHKIQFQFSPDWDGLTKTAVFTNGTLTKDVVQSAWADNVCSIPWELMVEGKQVSVAVYGAAADGTTLRSEYSRLEQLVVDGADPVGDASTSPTLPVWAQIQQLSTKAETDAAAALAAEKTAQDSATAKAAEASASATTAAQQAQAAADKAAAALASANAAAASATQAGTSATGAETAKATAQTAQTAAETARQAAQDAAALAATYRDNASASASAAASAASAAQAAQSAAAASQAAASASQSAAASSETNAKTSEDNAAASAASVFGLITPTAGAHNSIYRGKDITANVADGRFYTHIADGTFQDIYVGDYFTQSINGTNYVLRIAGCDVYWHRGDSLLTKHHVVVVPDNNFGRYQFNAANTSAGGYVGSLMYTDTLVTWAGYLGSSFGAHLISNRELLTNAISGELPSNWAWYTSAIDLMTVEEVTGHGAFGISGNNYGYNIGANFGQLPLFSLSPDKVGTGYTYWLRTITTSTSFEGISGAGYVERYGASASYALRPRFLLG